MTVALHRARPPQHRAVPLLDEPELRHYPEFADFLAAAFDLDTVGLAHPGLLSVDGRLYELVFVGRSGLAFPAGVEISALVAGLEPLDAEQADRDLWAILEWVVEGVGEPWGVDALRRTGRLYKIPAVPPE